MMRRSRKPKQDKVNRVRAGDVVYDGEGLAWIVDEARADSVRLVREGLRRTCTWERFAERYDAEPPGRAT